MSWQKGGRLRDAGATGTVYRFPAPGARLRVDARDAVALRKVPMLRAGG